MYYWVPSVYRTEFQTLCMHTVAIRGDLGAAISTFDVTILGLDAIPDCLPPAAAEGDAAGKRICYEEVTEGQLHLRIKIDKKIPNDTGYIEATIGGHVITGKDVLMLTPNTDTAPAEAGRPVSEKQKTDVLDLRLSLADIGLVSKDADDDSKEVKDAVARVEKDLQGQKVKIHLRSFIPTGSQTDVLLEGLRTQLELSRLGQMQ